MSETVTIVCPECSASFRTPVSSPELDARHADRDCPHCRQPLVAEIVLVPLVRDVVTRRAGQ